jgi:hypothetical protein
MPCSDSALILCPRVFCCFVLCLWQGCNASAPKPGEEVSSNAKFLVRSLQPEVNPFTRLLLLRVKDTNEV